MSRPSVAELIAADDLDGLLRRIDELCDGAGWDGLADLRSRCRSAFADHGRQMWPAAAHAEYRLALQAPGRWAAEVLVDGAGRFALGPLPEVAASTHSWSDLADHLPSTPEAARFAQERVCRGEDLSDATAGGGEIDLPLHLQPWEPDYPAPKFEPYRVTVPDVVEPELSLQTTAVGAALLDDPDGVDALADLVAVWRTQSEGQARTASVEGDALAALGAVRGAGQVAMAEVDPGHALGLMAWAAASGGARGRRRGLAYGRFSAWWAAAALGGLDLDGWPHQPDAVGDAAAGLRWYRWAPPDRPSVGWVLRIAVESPSEGVAWAIDASDSSDG